MASNPSVPPPSPQHSQLSPVPSPSTPQSALESAPLSEGQRLAYTFIAPSKTFTDLRRSANWWAPYLIIVIVAMIFVYAVDQKVGFRKVAENTIQLQPKQVERLDNMPADRREKAMQQQAAIVKIISYVFPLIGLIFYVFLAGLLFATVKFAAGADLKFKSMFALIVYTRLPIVLMSLLAALSLLAGVSGDSFNIENPLATNPGYFIGPEGSPVLRALLSPLDIFSIWTLILTAIGISCISKVKRGTAFAIVFGWFAFYVLAKVALAAVTS